MSEISELVMKRMNEIDSEIQLCQSYRRGSGDLESKPEGYLRLSNSKGYCRYYQCRKGENTGTYLKKSQLETAKKLAQNEYQKSVLKSLNRERQLLEKLHQFYSESIKDGEHFFAGPEELIWPNMREERKMLIDPIVPDDELYCKEWLSETYERKPFHEDAPEYYTESGIRVRSKSELIIAEKLEKAGIPFYYEKPLYIKGWGTIHPDFTVLNVRRRKTMFWEHQGMMDDEEYREYATERINQYALDGYYVGTELILTHETKNMPLRTRIIDSTIEKYLF